MKLSRLSFFVSLVVGAVALLLTGIAPLRASAPNAEPFVPPSSFRAEDLTAGSQELDRFIETMFSRTDGSAQVFLDGVQGWAGAVESTQAAALKVQCGDCVPVEHSGEVSGVGLGVTEGEAFQAAVLNFIADFTFQLPAFSCAACPGVGTGLCQPFFHIDLSLLEISIEPIWLPHGPHVLVTIKYEGAAAACCSASCNF